MLEFFKEVMKVVIVATVAYCVLIVGFILTMFLIFATMMNACFA